MTIIYQYRVATTSFVGFLKLLAAWRGSVYKLLFKESLVFMGVYAAISLTYRFALNDQQKLQFERVAIHCNSYTSLIPVSFVLGFYVTVVVQRWWQQFRNVPWPDRTIFVMCTYLSGQEERARIMRRTVARYMMFGMILIMRAVSVAVMKRFPTLDHIVEAGFITKDEAEIYEKTECQYLKFWVPLMWASNVLTRARHEGRIETEFGLRMVIEQLADFRDKCSLCFVYDWITIPLVYTQVVTLAVYSFFAACLVGRQFLDTEKNYPGYEYDIYIPVFTLLQFFFYMGWLKVAEQMINPFGEDDDDYDINWLMDRHTAVAFALVDQCCGRHPPLIRDQHWDETVMPEMPYTEASLGSRRPNFLGSTFNLAPPSTEDQRPATPGDTDRLRKRSHGSFAGSVLSLFSMKPHHRFLSGSRETIDSGDHHVRFLSVPNGRPGYMPVLTSETEKSGSVFLDMTGPDGLELPEGRERSNSERLENLESLPVDVRVRKKSSPSKFTVEAVEEPAAGLDNGVAVTHGGGGDAPSATRTRRSGQQTVMQTLQQLNSKAVSRPPVLSAIEEGGTVTSLRQILPSGKSDDDDGSSLSSMDDADVFEKPKAPVLEDIEETAELSSTPVPSVPIITIDEV
ncbi:hypothetical protein BaRGS_00035870 [Batillaria attramentaria]|uniref:Bestrophin homolog n=1 Tax=Batillaria attramentaria TaxID=370345 RepID=A0ABD0JDD0_9CAEN